jgi:hypothetical protein
MDCGVYDWFGGLFCLRELLNAEIWVQRGREVMYFETAEPDHDNSCVRKQQNNTCLRRRKWLKKFNYRWLWKNKR